MLKALIYKEFLKTYKIIAIFIVIFLGVILKTYLDAKNAFEYNDGVKVILYIAQREVFNFNYLEYFCPIFAIVLAIAQFYIEVSNARVRLHLHLPLSYFKLITFLISIGILFLILIFALITFGYLKVLNHFYPHEIFEAVFSVMLPIFLASLLCYLSVLMVFLEPNLLKKTIYIISTYLLFNLSMDIKNLFFASKIMNEFMVIVILIYAITSYHVFLTYKKGYIK